MCLKSRLNHLNGRWAYLCKFVRPGGKNIKNVRAIKLLVIENLNQYRFSFLEILKISQFRG